MNDQVVLIDYTTWLFYVCAAIVCCILHIKQQLQDLYYPVLHAQLNSHPFLYTYRADISILFLPELRPELSVKTSQVDAAVKLIDEGCTIPFIARYRKEVTGALNDEQLRELDDRLKYLRNLEDRKTQVIASIEEQGKLTDELKEQILKHFLQPMQASVA